MYLESTFLILISRSDDQQEEGACGGVPVGSQGKGTSKHLLRTDLRGWGPWPWHKAQKTKTSKTKHDKHQTAEYSYAYADKRFLFQKRPHDYK